MGTFVSTSKKFVFVHVPRTAGAFIVNLCLGKHGFKLKDRGYTDYHHLSCKNIPEEFSEYYKFGFMRNPFDRFVSIYFYQRGDRYPGPTKNKELALNNNFNEWIYKWVNLFGNVEQLDFLDGVDFIGKYETLNKDLIFLCKKFGMNVPNFNQRINESNHKYYMKYYDDESVEFINKVSNKDLGFYETNKI